jgi:hypothetical protein
MASDLVRITTVLHNLPIDTSLYYTEQCYSNLIRKILLNNDFIVNTEVYCCYRSPCGISFGFGKIDILVETENEIFIIELKANVKNVDRSISQVRRYLLHFKTNKTKYGILAMYNCGYKPIITIDVDAPPVKTIQNKLLVSSRCARCLGGGGHTPL